ncbi:unnamed protein product [Calypogeia fissa]
MSCTLCYKPVLVSEFLTSRMCMTQDLDISRAKLTAELLKTSEFNKVTVDKSVLRLLSIAIDVFLLHCGIMLSSDRPEA